jgi:organic radical activating enzyme
MRTKSNAVSNPYYTYGMLYKSKNFKEWEKSKGPKYRKYRKAWTDRVKNLDAGDFPLNLNTEITTRCNLACSFCTHLSLKPAQIGDIPFKDYSRAIKEGEKYGLPTVNINGLGEPLLRRDITDFIRYAKNCGVVDVMFHTNGTIMTTKLAEELIDSDLDRIVFSVDSPDKKTYESMRILNSSYVQSLKKQNITPRGVCWEKTVDNVLLFIKVRNSRGLKSPIVRATMVATEKTISQVPKLLALWKPHVDHITVQDLTWRTKLLENGHWENKETSALSENFDVIREEAIRKKISFICPFLYQSIYQFYGGGLIPCGNPNARTHLVMGQWGSQTIHEVWTGKKYRELRKLHCAGKWHEHPICRDCDVALLELYKDMLKQNIKIEWRSSDLDRDLARMGEQLEAIYLKDHDAA